MEKKGISELRKIFENNNKKVNEKVNQNINKEKEKSSSFHEKKDSENITNKKISLNKSISINNVNINNIINNKDNLIRKSLEPNIFKSQIQNNEEKKNLKLITEKKTKNEEINIKNDLREETKLQKIKSKEEEGIEISKKDSSKNIEKNPSINDNIKPDISNNKSDNNGKNEKEFNKNFKDKIEVFNNFIEKNNIKESNTQSFRSRIKTFDIKNKIKSIAKINLEKYKIDGKEYAKSFENLQNLQSIIKKESSFRELCKINYIII